MDLVPAQLAALAAIADHGTFDAAAKHLNVTPSAVSQRIRALESEVGQVVVQRTTPCLPTPAGEVLLRLARQTRLLHDEVRDALAHGHLGAVDLPVAINADSLATWFREVLDEVATWTDVSLRLHVEDQAYSADQLRSGDVLAAVTSDPVAVQGCSVETLGLLRYVPSATPVFAERWRRGRGPDWAAMPVVVFNDKDTLQHDLLEARGVAEPPVVHRVPTSADFREAVARGLGWGMIPVPQRDGRLVPLGSRLHVDVPLYWQRWRLDSPTLDRLGSAVRAAARTALRQ
jgi:LysR family transcriptional regulator (chromosome initiation inhibitor)